MTKHKKWARAGKPSQSRWQIGVVVGVFVLVAAVLALKGMASSAPATAESSAADLTTLSSESQPAAGARPARTADEEPQAYLERMLSEGYPILAFFHSTTCYQCTEMTRIVGEVYPEFENQVALVAVNVYEEHNYALIQKANIRVIPTLIFIERDGTMKGFTGIMAPEQLKDTLATLALGDNR
jgi:thioredoxin-like negative regulator of GroEL